jgi:SPP1 family predicted phage head-tail adaptor
VTIWTTIAQPLAEVIGLDGREAVLALSLQGVSSFRIRIWYGHDIQPADQVKHDGRDLNVRSVIDPNGDRKQLVILADTASTQPTA